MTRTGAFLGTPRYMSPEQVEGKPADNRADLYSYGLILYEMVTGDVPFTGESTLKVMYQRIQEKPKSPKLIKPDLPNWLVRIIMGVWNATRTIAIRMLMKFSLTCRHRSPAIAFRALACRESA